MGRALGLIFIGTVISIFMLFVCYIRSRRKRYRAMDEHLFDFLLLGIVLIAELMILFVVLRDI